MPFRVFIWNPSWFAPCGTLHPNFFVIYMWTMLRVTPLQWPNWGNFISWGGIVDNLANYGLGTPFMQWVMPCAASDARPCLGNKLLSFPEQKTGFWCVQFVHMCTAEYFVYCPCTTAQAIYILNWFFLPNCVQFVLHCSQCGVQKYCKAQYKCSSL